MVRKPKTQTVAKDLKDIPAETFTEAPETNGRFKTDTLPAMTGPGVEVPRVPVLDKLIAKYEKEKEKRCAASPGEIQAKKELQFALHQQKNSLPVNSDGFPFYRSDDYGRDYVLVEKMKAIRHNTEDDDD